MKNIIIFLFISLFALGCLKKVQYPAVPNIEFKSFEIIPNGNSKSAKLTFHFTDGDGDIGLGQADTTGSYCSDTCLFYYNLFCEYYEKQNGEWIHYPIDWQNGLIPFYYRIPDVTPTGQNSSLSGDIIVDMNAYYLITTPGDTCRFEVTLADRSLNLSNTIMTSEFTKN